MSLPRLISCAGLIAIFFLSNAEADIFRFRDKEGVWHFSNTRSDARYRLYIRTRGIGGKQYLKEYEDVIRKAAEQFGIEREAAALWDENRRTVTDNYFNDIADVQFTSFDANNTLSSSFLNFISS